MAADGRGDCHGSFRGFSLIAVAGTTEFASERTALRAVATTVAFAVVVTSLVALAAKTRGFHGSPCQHPRQSTGVPR